MSASRATCQARLSSDKLRWTGGVKLGLGMAFLRCLEELHRHLARVTAPLLILHGENDRRAAKRVHSLAPNGYVSHCSLCQPAGSHLLAREAASTDKRIKTYPGASHHLILEVGTQSGSQPLVGIASRTRTK